VWDSDSLAILPAHAGRFTTGLVAERR